MVEHVKLAKCGNDAIPLLGWALNGTAIGGAIPGSAGRKTGELLAVSNPAVVLNGPTVVVFHPLLDLDIGCHSDLCGGQVQEAAW